MEKRSCCEWYPLDLELLALSGNRSTGVSRELCLLMLAAVLDFLIFLPLCLLGSDSSVDGIMFSNSCFSESKHQNVYISRESFK